MKSTIYKLLAGVTVLTLTAFVATAQTTVYSDDFNRAALGGGYTISQGGGGGTAFIISSTTLCLTNGSPAGWVSVATNIPNAGGFNPTLDSCSGLVSWSFNMRFGRTGNTPSGFTSGSYGNGYVLACDNTDFSAAGAKGYAVLFGNSSSPDSFRLVAFTNGIRVDYVTAGSGAGNALIVGTGAFAVTTQAAANDYYSFKVTFDPATKIWTFDGRDDGSSAFADPASGSFTSIGTFTETTPIFRATALGRMGAYWAHSTGANNPSQFDNFKLVVVGGGTSLAIDNTGTPSIGSIVAGSSDVPLFGFQLTPSGGSVDFTALKLTTAGTATSSDLSNFRIAYDADASGTFNGGDSVVSGAGQALANPINFTVTGQTGFSAARRYLVIANVAGGAALGRTFTGSIAAADVTSTAVSTNGTAAGNPQTIAAAAFDLTMDAVAASESATISSLINDATIPTTSQGAQVWQVLFTNPAGNSGATAISTIAFTPGVSNSVGNWTNVIQAAGLFDGTTLLAAGTVTPTNIAFSGLGVNIADNSSKTLSLRISLKSTAGVLTDNSVFQCVLNTANVSVSGNGLASGATNSDPALNVISVVATKLVFTAVPAFVVTNDTFSATVQAQDANGNRDRDSITSVTISLVSGSGILGGGSALPLLSGVRAWSALTYDTLDTFTVQADDSILTPAVSPVITGRAAPTLTEVILPQYIQGGLGSNGKRLPYACCVTISNLTASATYRYYNQCVTNGDIATSTGAGNCIFAASPGSFVKSSNPGLSTAGSYGTFTTDANGSYTGWFITEPTGNGRFSTAGNQVFMRIVLNDGADGTSVDNRLTTENAATVLAFGTTASATSGTGIRGNSSATDKNFVVLYDNTAGTGRALAATLVENDGAAEDAASSFVQFYSDSVNGISGAWGTIIPNLNASGVQRIDQRSLAGAALIASNTDADGVWPSSANTVDPIGGDATPIVISSSDAPLVGAAPQITYLAINSISLSGANLLLGVTNQGAGTCYVLASTNVTAPRASWTAIATNVLTGSSNFTLTATNAVSFIKPRQFYILSTTNNF